MLPVALISMLSCSQSGSFEIPREPLTLEVTSPEYGIYAGTDQVMVTGIVQPANAVVTVENREVVVGSDGSFAVEVPIAGVYRNLDVRAFFFEEQQHTRVPVFSGTPPLDSWPGGIGMRVTPQMLESVAAQIAVGVDEGGWQQGLLDGFTPIENDGFTLHAVGVRNRPAEAFLIPTAEGLELGIRIRDIVVELEAAFPVDGVWQTSPIDLGYQEFTFRASTALEINSDGMLVLGLDDAGLSITDPIVQLGPFDLSQQDVILQGLADLVNGLGNGALTLLLGQLTNLELGGPFDFEIDLLGTPLAISLAGLGTDPEGVFVDLGLAIGEPIPDPLVVHRPTLDEGGPRADLILGLHEGIFSPLIESDLLDLLEQDLTLGGVLGIGLGVVFTNLPGGDSAPEADAWCVQVSPGSARTVRMNADLARMITVYLPDMQMNVGITHDGIDCDPWLSASLAVEANFEVNGTELDLGIDVPDGSIQFYGATSEYTEAEVIEGVGGLFDVLFGLLGGGLGFDLGDILGGGGAGVPGLEGDPEIVGIYAIEDDAGAPVEGLFAVSLDLL